MSSAPRASWSRRADIFDWLVATIAIGLAIASVYSLSVPIPTFSDAFALVFAWPIAGMVWALVVLGTLQDRAARLAARLLLVGAMLSIGVFVPYMFGIIEEPALLAAGLVLGLVLFGLMLVRERQRRVVWLVAPVAVLAMIALLVSGIATQARFRWAEPALTAYATEVLGRPTVEYPEDVHPSALAV